MKVRGGWLEPTPKQRPGSGLGSECPKCFPVLNPSDQNPALKSLVLAVASERRHIPSRSCTGTNLKAFTWAVSLQGGGRASAQSRWQEDRPRGARKPEHTALRHCSPRPPRGRSHLQPAAPRKLPEAAPRGLRGWKGAPVPFWAVPASPEGRPPPGLRVPTFPHRAMQNRTAERRRPWGLGILPAALARTRAPQTMKPGSLAPLWRPWFHCAFAGLGRIREGPVECALSPGA